MRIPFNRPYITGKEIGYIQQALDSGRLAGNGELSRRCAQWLERTTGCEKAILLPSGTAALEMMMILARIGPGDEVIMPSFTFSSTANAVVLRGATPVFTDIRPDTLNIDENLIEAAITPRTRAIVPVHYAGVACEMDAILSIAERHGLMVLEDSAQGILSYYKGRHLGSLGRMGALSFHETKNIHCGEGGALLINDPALAERAEIVMEKGTDRSKFFRGEVDKYTWVDVGSSFLVSEITAAFLWAQLEEAESIVARRLAAWEDYHEALAPLEGAGLLRRPIIPPECSHNGHIYYLLLNTAEERDALMMRLKSRGILSVFHYVPLDTAAAGQAYASPEQMPLPLTAGLSARLLRLPLFVGVGVEDVVSEIGLCLGGQEVRV
ncbi:MAG: dTDP-4-amino-4,6-dideoxygalactose transaminase [Synergistota bacterium]|nr:dTDP-4-amino-4,6-dideoxygalactose transaminase [Synergistota bacterium]